MRHDSVALAKHQVSSKDKKKSQMQVKEQGKKMPSDGKQISLPPLVHDSVFLLEVIRSNQSELIPRCVKHRVYLAPT